MALRCDSSLSFTILEDQGTGLPTPDPDDANRSFDELTTRSQSLEATQDIRRYGRLQRKGIKEKTPKLGREIQSHSLSTDIPLDSPSSNGALSSPTASAQLGLHDYDSMSEVSSSPSRRISAVTVSSISELESEDKYPIRYSPLSNRATFRSPDSAVDAICAGSWGKLQSPVRRQREDYSQGGKELRRLPLSRGSRGQRSPSIPHSPPADADRGSPGSVKSMGSARSSKTTRSEALQRQASVEKQQLGPLVLLHVSVLQSTEIEYSDTLLSTILPPRVLRRYQSSRARLLQNVGPVVRQRGILLRHPRNNFDELSERVLATLNLDGGVDMNSEDELSSQDAENENGYEEQQCLVTEEATNQVDSDSADSDDTACETYCPTPQLSQRYHPSPKICSTCGRPRRFLRIDENAHSHCYDVNVYAANGLVSADVWEAVWQEMERVDVEINATLPEKWRQVLNERIKEIERQAEEEALVNEALAKEEPFDETKHIVGNMDTLDRLNELEGQPSGEDSEITETLRTPGLWRRSEGRSEDRLTKSIENEEMRLQASSTSSRDETQKTPKRSVSCEKLFQMFKDPKPVMKKQEPQRHVPLSVLLTNYIWLLAQDARNIAIFALGLAAIVLLMSRSTAPLDRTETAESQLPESIVVPSVETTEFLPLEPVARTVGAAGAVDNQWTGTLLASISTASTEKIRVSSTPEQRLTTGSTDSAAPENHSSQVYDDLPLEPPEPLDPWFCRERPTTGRMDQSIARPSLLGPPLLDCCALDDAPALLEDCADEEDADEDP
ncbi:MAG: hypothetical protein M1821_009818 [Bathelium mastoideum]|nr:MAG: hypothetical protein M1821_009818 [Bathelium mastoideum]